MTTSTYVIAHRTAKARVRLLHTISVDYGEKRPTKTPPLKSVEENDLVELHIGCPCKIKIIESAGMLLIEKSSLECHNHEYSALEFKMPSRKIASLEVAKGYKPSEVNKTLRNAKNGNLEALEIAWGANFSAKAVHNATQSWVRSHGSMAEERIPKSTSPKASDDRIGPTRRELEVREILDSVLSCYINLEAQTKDMPEELRDTILQNWIASLRTQTDFLRLVGENRSKPGDTKRLTKQIG